MADLIVAKNGGVTALYVVNPVIRSHYGGVEDKPFLFNNGGSQIDSITQQRVFCGETADLEETIAGRSYSVIEGTSVPFSDLSNRKADILTYLVDKNLNPLDNPGINTNLGVLKHALRGYDESKNSSEIQERNNVSQPTPKLEFSHLGVFGRFTRYWKKA